MAKTTSTSTRQDPKLAMRQEQLVQLQEIVSRLDSDLQTLLAKSKLQKQQDSVSKGLYDEIEKLTKKAPGEQVTELALEQINDLIQQTKNLISGDRYVDRIKEFVPAGDMPELRDAMIVLRQIRQALERFAEGSLDAISQKRSAIEEAQMLKLAITFYLQGARSDNLIKMLHREIPGLVIPKRWLTENYPQVFDFDYLDTLNLIDYFGDK